MRYPSVGLNNPSTKACTVASVLDPHFHPRQPSPRKRHVCPHRLGWSGQPDTGASSPTTASGLRVWNMRCRLCCMASRVAANVRNASGDFLRIAVE